MNEDEAASIALHLVNSQTSENNMDEIVNVVKMVNDLLNIVKYHFQMAMDEDSVNYDRFLTHLRFFSWRLIRKEKTNINNEDDFLFQQVKRQYEKAYQCSVKMAAYVEKTYQWTISNDEKVYLTLHIHRVTSRQEWKQHTSQLDCYCLAGET
ncbi:PRD domain-containing protein [Jeotgalibacillus soli]|uniref:Transcription antiterminator LicT n=1 Tax=Jeotgalibacillus soli TaxID=889306 RepID=A0A0C2R4S7_9BACL|nr:PRD domain-containing protein [Jeotgalibacillus soli]KIL45280.1 transcription antiterminator LicT [Jeotgalibacillus soli]